MIYTLDIKKRLKTYRLYVVTYRYVKSFKNMGLSSRIYLGKKHGNFNVLSWACGLVRRYENN
jgi:hypothetical protein